MNIRFYGAARTVTGSQHVIEVNGKTILLECGIYQGKRKHFYERNCCFAFEPKEIDAVILSHAHIDHSGNLPNLVKQGYKKPIFATAPTVDLASIMLKDSAKIYEEDANYLNRKRRKHGQPMVEPLYEIEDAERAAEQFQEMEYDQIFEPVDGVKARFVDAGHILGSAAVVLDIQEGNKQKRLWFSGDIGRKNLPLLRDPVEPVETDYLLMECTYGDKPHRDPEEAYQEFKDVVLRTVQRGGKVVVPAFSVGRTQELVFCLNRMISEEELPPIPVFVDSPLAIDATGVYKKYPQYYDDDTHQFTRTGTHPALMFPTLKYTRPVDESKAINDMDEPMVIISASGMAEAGRILHHLIHNVSDPKNTICIVSWMAPNTLGRRLAERQKTVPIFGEQVRVRAEIATIGGLSAHAGQDFLLEYALAAKQNGLEKVFLVHGEEKPAEALMQLMRNTGISQVSYPDHGDVFKF